MQLEGNGHENRLYSGIINVRRCGAWWGSNPRPSSSGQAEGLHYQRTRTLDPTAQAAFTPLAQAAQKAAGGRTFVTDGGRIVGLEGATPPKRVVINEFDSVEQAEAYY